MYIFKIAQVINENVRTAFLYVLSIYMDIFILTLCFDDSFFIDCYPAGVSNKHCLLSLFHFYRNVY